MKERTRKSLSAVARVGYTARGVVFLIIAGLAGRSAFLQRSRPEGARGAFEAFLPVPFGRLMLGLIAVGLAGYVLWRFVQAATVPFSDTSGWKTLPRRIAFGISGAFYCLLMIAAIQLALGLQAPSGDAEEELTAWVLEIPLGATVLAIIGGALVAGGLHTAHRGVARRFLRLYDDDQLTGVTRTMAQVVGVVGLVTMGLTLVTVGGFVVQAGLVSKPSRIHDLSDVLHTVAVGEYGRIFLGIVAVGLVAYAAHCYLLAVFRKIGA